MKNYNLLNNIIGWLCFGVAAFVYTSTMEPTASFWDCGEYIATAYKLEVGHPPGAPFFQMLGRFFSLFAMGDVTKVALMINLMSALSSAFTILFLFWSITALIRRMIAKNETELSTADQLIIFGSGVVGAIAYTFSDSFWFSAVEGEVYAMSSMFTAAVFWAMLKWERIANEPGADRWIVLIVYLIGMSIGVHLLNLLAVPALVFIYYFKKYEVTRKGFIYTFIISVLLLGGIQNVIIPGVVSLAANYELFFINTIGLPFNSGTIIYFILLVSILVVGVRYSHHPSSKLFNTLLALGGLFLLLALIASPSGSAVMLRLAVGGLSAWLLFKLKNNYATLNTIMLCVIVLLIGYSSFFMLVIRSKANTPIDENNPENAITMLSYLNREQYGDNPLLFGQYYNAPLDPQEPYKDGNPVYMRQEVDNTQSLTGVDGGPQYKKDSKKNKYVISDDRKNSVPNYDKRFCTIFPRMWSSQSNHEAAYKNWGKVTGQKITIMNNEGKSETVIKPTFFENLTYFFSYQVNHMYFRYFFWNFVGRQNDIQGHGNSSDGNWISGIPAVDSFFGVAEKGLPDSLKNNKAKNKFYALPFLLGLIGLWFHFNKYAKDAWVVMLLFLFTGLAIVVYLNQYPYQPRERDYAFSASFYAFAIWIGLGVYGLYELLKNTLSDVPRAALVSVLCLSVPAVMAKDGWDDHDRSGRYTARDFAINYLNSCAPNAILFTNGDNDTFPLWYVQEVEGIRTDVRVVNLSLLNTDWYIDQMKRKAYNSDPVPFSMTNDKYRQGTRDYVAVYPQKAVKGYVNLKELIDFVSSNDQNKQIPSGDGSYMPYFPTNKMSIPVDTNKVVKNGLVSEKLKSRIVPSIDWEVNKNYIMKNDLLVLDLLANFKWDRPVYFAVTTGPEAYIDLQDYFQLEGLAFRLVPIKNTPEEQQMGSRVATDIMYDNIMNKFKWGNIKKPGTFLDENIMRMIMNLRLQMGALASALIEEGKNDMAIKVLNKCREEMPEENAPYDATMYSITGAYYQAGDVKQANELAEKLFKNFKQEFNYYSTLSGAYEREKRQAADIMQRLVYMAKSFKQDELSKKFEKELPMAIQQQMPAGN
ncbi:MAG: DUF2723 domain-containing protein [Bacteroidetes bacterium]|nr:DUF2723 domain-containing protein [Bacteroidota bacterium]